MKREIAEQFGDHYARLAVLLNDARGWAKATLPTFQERKLFFESIVGASRTRSRCCATATKLPCWR